MVSLAPLKFNQLSRWLPEAPFVDIKDETSFTLAQEGVSVSQAGSQSVTYVRE